MVKLNLETKGTVMIKQNEVRIRKLESEMGGLWRTRQRAKKNKETKVVDLKVVEQRINSIKTQHETYQTID